MYATYAKTRSAKLTVTTPSKEKIIISNMGGNEGFHMSFDGRRSMDHTPGEFSVQVVNLPPEALSKINAAQTTMVDDYDALLAQAFDQAFNTLEANTVAADGSDALKAGLCIIELAAGYDGFPSTIFKAIGSKISTRYDGSLTSYVTTFQACENLDGALFGAPKTTFEAGGPLFDCVDFLRKQAGLGPGNFNPATWAALTGSGGSKMTSNLHFSGGQALDFLDQVLKWMPLRWFIDDRQFYICGREGWTQSGGPPPWVTDGIEIPEVLLSPPSRDEGGRVQVECLLCPRIKPGRLVNLTPGGLSLVTKGMSPTLQQIQQAQVPPGLYRADEVQHSGDTGSGPWTTRILLRGTKGAKA